jgi:hypothetical protein
MLRNPNSESYCKIIGCTVQELKEHLEKHFHSGMTWENRSVLWQVNHVKPLREAYDQGEEAFTEAQHYENLRPELRSINCREKRNKTFTARVIKGMEPEARRVRVPRHRTQKQTLPEA